MGKKRNTAKTGDKKLYKSRGNVAERKSTTDNNIYDSVDRFHSKQDEEFLRLTQDQEDNILEDDDYGNKEAVLDLGAGESTSEDESNYDGDSQSEDKYENDNDNPQEKSLYVSSSDDDSNLQTDEGKGVRDWGPHKNSLYGGDTADLEIGQDDDDAYLEEEAAKEIQAARYDDMEEQDFLLSDDGDSDGSESNEEVKYLQNSKELARSKKRKFLQSHHPELLPLVNHFSDVVQDWNERTRVVSQALFSSDGTSPEDLGTTKKGLEYLLTKSLIQTSTALNVSSYLLLKVEQMSKKPNIKKGTLNIDTGIDIKSHPVIARLQELNKLNTNLEKKVETKVSTLSSQMEKLIEAASLLGKQNESEEENDNISAVDDSNREIVEEEVRQNSFERDIRNNEIKKNYQKNLENQERTHDILNEARFGLRPQEISISKNAKLIAPTHRKTPFADFGDEENEPHSREASKSLASTINSIQQRSASKAHSKIRVEEGLDDHKEVEIRNGLEMMEAELGEISDEVDGEVEEDNQGFSFYDKVKRESDTRKSVRKELYQVAPKYPETETEIYGERAISKTILKNRGLVAHKAKLNRNPRVKKREQYRKAIIRRKGKVREIRTGEGHRYSGEETGIKSRVSRSRKLSPN